LVALAGAACGLLIGTAGAAGDPPGTPAGTVAFVGDSNLLIGGTALDLALSDRLRGYLVVNSARSGAAIRSHGGGFWDARLAGLKRAIDADAYVVNLGINDTASPGSMDGAGYGNYGKKIDWLLSRIDAKVPVLWSNLPCEIEPADRAKGCAAVNRALIGARSRHRNLTVVDWAKTANRRRDWIFGIHYTPGGQAAYAKAIAAALDARR
jgi:hypothetical protein